MPIYRNCLACSKSFPVYPSQVKKGRFCSFSCFLSSIQSLEARFWEKVDKVSSPNGCWLWTGFRNKDGYGKFRTSPNKHMEGAHRVSFLLIKGPIPDGLHVLHNCPNGDNPSCVNPQHLWLGTHKDNMRDAASKGSFINAGEKNANAKLTAEQAKEIFKLKGVLPIKEIMRMFNIAKPTVSHVWNRRTWREATEEYQVR